MNTILISYQTYQAILFSWIGIALIVFIVLLRVTAPYGRHTTAKWGPQINNRLGWILMEAPVLILVLTFTITSWDIQTSITLTMIGLFCLHYINRTDLPFRLHTRANQCPGDRGLAIFFNLMNGFSLGYYFKYFADYPQDWFLDIRFIIGSALFFIGLAINWKADNELIHLRKPNETHYVIPQSKLFRYISCPNLFGN
jgi:hypothetical protein